MVGRGHLLLVEDEAGLRDLVARFLRLEGYAVTEAGDGREAIDLLDAPGPARIDLALVDLNLPHVHGVEVCRHLRRSLPDTPAIICSAAIVCEHDRALRSLGVHRYLTKPYHPADLLVAIESALADPIGPGPGPMAGGSGSDLVTTAPGSLG